MRVKHIYLIHIVNKSSKFNIGLSEFAIVGYSFFIIINNNNSNEPISIRLKRGENPKTFYLFVTTQVCLIQSVYKRFMFNISYLYWCCVRFFSLGACNNMIKKK